ncbi:hypothetical protein CLAFUW4_07668 [Fulvia fulva]|uniref:F-box domain-containing protein n=1 Tax=Passalora fulva TaxID=5499 RepID=A0A9Q8LCN8_PASFU|nr:uncharacterized protein CLAFUR5_07797 [Fulvia fulva]KAK4629709.1 hypothetical protein CLAFUR4_07673 [Fulvia fulva]KAK4630828.1 hypothetical protein CLAFUR0_07673 [Fulvia fulva]UJO14988.1 hypothetical protein CLAFUR5_07797 [Fulvia fulva]WPV12846.1 hypothetical protein CLAFUW4_07668 [Fulvia fulva]WPV27388.1 hypothetical protein CLAFUW7_07669 [Fulvia fulva]
MVVTPRKLHKYRRDDLGDMEVMSIADHERAQQQQLDRMMDSAVDQLEALTDPTISRTGMKQLMLRSGETKLDDKLPFHFDFEPPTTSRTWPGLKYGLHSLHKRLQKPMKPRPSSVRKHSRHDDSRQIIRPKKVPSTKKMKQQTDLPSVMRSVASRNPPLHLLGLPAEIRNSIWSLLAVRDGPIEAQLRQIQPCRRLSKLRGRVIRKFPQKPAVAGVSHQVRREVLSIFYGANQFIFEKNACKLFEDYSITNPIMMQKWSPPTDIANFMSHVDIKFHAFPKRSLDPLSIVFELRKVRDGKATIKVVLEKGKKKKAAQADQLCLCEELDVVGMVQSELDKDLMHVAMSLVKKRNETSFSSPALPMLSKNDKRYQQRETCTRCEKPTLEIVYSGT